MAELEPVAEGVNPMVTVMDGVADAVPVGVSEIVGVNEGVAETVLVVPHAADDSILLQ